MGSANSAPNSGISDVAALKVAENLTTAVTTTVTTMVTNNYTMAGKIHGGNVALDTAHTNSMIDMEDIDTVKPFIIPVIGLLVGAAMMQKEKIATIGKLVLYFGAQSFMNIFMGWIFRTHVTVPKGFLPAGGTEPLKEALHGCPIGFALTAMQQLISFFCFLALFGVLWATPYRITPRKINSLKESVSIVIFGCVFAMNIALNNFSLGYISIAVNLIIRSCLPLTTFLSQQGLAYAGLYTLKPCRALEISLMAAGVACAAAFTITKINCSGKGVHQGSNQALGAVMCIASLLCGSVNLALAGVLGEMKMSVYDTVAYMSVPAFFFLLPFCCIQKPIPGTWPAVLNKEYASDFEILTWTYSNAQSTFHFFVLSGVLSFIYNIIQFTIVHTLSPSATAFGGNFNKAALVFLTLLLPFLQVHSLPGYPCNWIIWMCVIGNVAAFSLYSYLQIKAKQEKAAQELKEKEAMLGKVEDEDDDEESEEEGGCC